MYDLIEGKVAKILTSRELVINVGAKDKVKIGMIFDVIDKKGENIVDPDTKDIIGSIERAKVRVKVTSLQDRLSVATTFEKTEINVGGEGGLLGTRSIAKMFMPAEWVTKIVTLKTNEKTWEDLDEKDSYVKIGDPVRQVLKVDEI